MPSRVSLKAAADVDQNKTAEIVKKNDLMLIFKFYSIHYYFSISILIF